MKRQEQTKKQPKEEIQTTQELVKNTKEKYNYKLTEQDIKEIMLYYYLDNRKQTIKELADKYNISTRRYYQIVKDKNNIKLIDDDINAMKKNFTKKSQIIIDKALNKINSNIEEGTANTRDLITTIGILYDKTRLENNLSTSNKELHINIKIE